MLLQFVSLVFSPAMSVDSATISLKPELPAGVGMTWVAFDAEKRVVSRGSTPATLKQAANGVPLTYCADNGIGFLELVVLTENNRIRATARCTKVLVRGTAIRTEGVLDPRSAPATYD